MRYQTINHIALTLDFPLFIKSLVMKSIQTVCMLDITDEHMELRQYAYDMIWHRYYKITI